MPAITHSEAERLERLERTVDRGRQHFLEVGAALKEIKADKLYKKKGHRTFEAYVSERFGFSRQHANRIVKAAELAPLLEPTGSKMPTERQLREVAKAPEEKRAAVAEKAKAIAEESGSEPTAKTYEEARNEICGPPIQGEIIDDYEDVPDDDDDDAAEQPGAPQDFGDDDDYEDVDDGDDDDAEVEIGESRGVGIGRAHEAIACLKRIPKADALRGRAMEIVVDWIEFNDPAAQSDDSPLTSLRPRVVSLTDDQLIVVREWITERLGGDA